MGLQLHQMYYVAVPDGLQKLFLMAPIPIATRKQQVIWKQLRPMLFVEDRIYFLSEKNI